MKCLFFKCKTVCLCNVYINTHMCIYPWRRKWQPPPILLPEKSHGQRSLASYSPGGCKEWDMTEQLTYKHILKLRYMQIVFVHEAFVLYIVNLGSIFILLFSHQVMSNSLGPYELQHARLPCPSLSSEFAQIYV